ncbi:hypothetical protein Golob_019916 [Gossypium lobatum]|uniref:Uncharacterized protein n=1 Tax=Gossypium lobatum TaxID=34289 RepID=A0A7J8L8V7_9ROSI|nr:hypothetical protein [Gossypium lobatum]
MFGFVRFEKMVDERMAINRLNNFLILGYKISIYMARFKGRSQVGRTIPFIGKSSIKHSLALLELGIIQNSNRIMGRVSFSWREPDEGELLRQNDDVGIKQPTGTYRLVNISRARGENVNGGCKRTWENDSKMGEEQLCGSRASINLGGRGNSDKDEDVVNASLSDSNINNRSKLILDEAKNAWEVRKMLGFSVTGYECEVVDEIIRLEGL